jgi:hypothetical protein
LFSGGEINSKNEKRTSDAGTSLTREILMKKIAPLLLFFSVKASPVNCKASITPNSYKRVIQQFIKQKRQEAQAYQSLIAYELHKNTVLTPEQKIELDSLLDQSVSIVNKVYFDVPGGLLYEALCRLLQQGNFNAFDSVAHLDQAAKELPDNDLHYKALRNTTLKQMKEDFAPIKRDITKITEQDGIASHYQTILKGSIAAFGIRGLAAAFYKCLQKPKSTTSHLKTSPNNPRKTRDERNPKQLNGSPSFETSASTQGLSIIPTRTAHNPAAQVNLTTPLVAAPQIVQR